MKQTGRAYLSIGSNIEPERNLRSAIAALRERFDGVVMSAVYRFPAVGFDGPDFLNAAAAIDSDIDPFALNRWLYALEARYGRTRTSVKFCSRTMDVDMVYFDALVFDGPGELILPRPELSQAFVLKPLAEIEPCFVDPIRGHTLQQLWDAHPERNRDFPIVEL
ncbi:MAG: 2-amino-4-hydroxy-6-hydroxymethyldihydropteridine diphosphokinase [Thermomonas sp.]